MEKKSMMGISVWTDWYIRTEHPDTGLLGIPECVPSGKSDVFLPENRGSCVWKNYMNYVDLKDYIYLVYEVNCDGKLLERNR